MYKDLLELYRKTNITIFTCAITYLLEKGTERISELTDEDINSFEGNGLMTASYVQAIARTARDITKVIENGIEIIQFCSAESIFETVFYTNGEHLDRTDIEIALNRCINGIKYGDLNDIANDDEDFADYLDLDIDEFKTAERGW